MAIKLILDTDIGTDIDDAWALALCLASDEIDLIGVTLVHADLDTRAKIALKMLKLAGRTDVPVYKGLSNPLTPGAKLHWPGHEGTDTDFSDISGMEAPEGAIEFINDTLDRYPGEVVLASIGPMTNVAAAIQRDPASMRKARRFAIMAANYTGEGPENAAPEHNAVVDPVATKAVFESDITSTVVGLNVTGKVVIRESDVEKLVGTPFGDYLGAMTRQYYGIAGRDYTFMHDPLAIATEIDRSVVNMRKMRAEVLVDGRIIFSHDNNGPLDVAVDVDVEKFEQLLFSKVDSLVKKGV